MRWPREDEIRWIEWRLRELEKGKRSRLPLSQLDYRIWLAHQRDAKSYADIARSEYPRYWRTNKGKRGNQQIISLIRRVVNKVERYLAKPMGKLKKSQLAQYSADYRAISLGAVPIYVERSSFGTADRKARRKRVPRKKRLRE